MLAGKKKINYFKNEARSFYLETKYDGQRIQLHFSKEEIKLFSRNGIDMTMTYEDILGYCKDAICDCEVILDGELVVWNV